MSSSSSFNHNDHGEQQQQQKQLNRDKKSPRYHHNYILEAVPVAIEKEWFELQRKTRETGEFEWEELQSLVSTYDDIHQSYRGVQEANEEVQTSHDTLIEAFERSLTSENNNNRTSELETRRSLQGVFESNREVQVSNYRLQAFHEYLSKSIQNRDRNEQIIFKKRKQILKNRQENLILRHIRNCRSSKKKKAKTS